MYVHDIRPYPHPHPQPPGPQEPAVNDEVPPIGICRVGGALPPFLTPSLALEWDGSTILDTNKRMTFVQLFFSFFFSFFNKLFLIIFDLFLFLFLLLIPPFK